MICHQAKRQSVTVRDLDAKRVEVLDGLEAGGIALTGPHMSDLRDGAPITMEGTVYGAR